MIVFYQKSTGKVLSYQAYKEKKANGDLIRPSLIKCSENHEINISDLEVKEFTKDLSNLSSEELLNTFKDNIADLDESDLEVI